ncbi:MAG: membrane protein insertase YidC, partial [Flavobacteriales bacterium]|nr:membrane protein insertase YidC [Flavobacteriales bacterium]
LVQLGPSFIDWVSKWMLIPLFNVLSTVFSSYGIIILLITVIIKMVLFPITYKTYLSSAKMRVLKPQIDAINKKHEGGDAMKKQQAIMALYKSTGVNPLAGCIPMLIQMPILFAMFRFFPASIELRQESFLWATDLSSYDQIFSWTMHIPLISDFYGNHISLFAIMMAGSSYLSMSANNTQMGGGNEMQAKQMQMMMKFMPIMLLFIFNSLPSGLNYYYFLANMMTFGQQWAIKRFFIDENKILDKLEAFKLSPKAKKGKSSFVKKLEDLAKEKGYKPPK